MDYVDDNLNKQKIKEAIVETIAYFDIFDFPLTGYEIWRFLGVKCDLEELIKILDLNIANVESQNGFYFAKGRFEIVRERMRRYNFTDRKMKRAAMLAKIFKFIPWVKMVAVGNLMGTDNLRDESDIDLFIISEKGRVWLTRFFCTSFVQLLGWRPKKNDQRDKICLSFFISEEALNLDFLRLSEEDVYFVYWLAGLLPVYDANKTYIKFLDSNSWLKNYLPNWRPVVLSSQRQAKKTPSMFYRDIVDLFFGGLELKFKKLQLKIFPTEIREVINKSSGVVVNDKVLKLHLNDRREEYRKKYKNRSEQLLNNGDNQIDQLILNL